MGNTARGPDPAHRKSRPTCACRNYKYSLCEYRFPLKILMKINESLAKINTAVFYVLSAPEYNQPDFDRKKRKWRRNRSEDLFFLRSP